MSAPTDPAERLATLAGELQVLGRRLDGMGAELLTMRFPAPDADPAVTPPTGIPRTATPAAAPTGAAPTGAGRASGPAGAGPTGAVAAGPAGAPGPAPYPWPPPGPHPYPPAHPRGYPPVAQPRPPYPVPGPSGRGPVPAGPAPSARPSWLPELTSARLLAWTGGAVTLLGVVLLMVLAASRGWFSPTARVVVGAVLGLALVALSLRMHRRASSRTGAVVVAATGVATLYLVIAAAATVVGILPTPAAVVQALVVAACGLALADRWRTEALGTGTTVAAVLLVAVLAQGPLLVALALVLQVAALPVLLRRRWLWLAIATAVGPVLYGTVVAVLAADRPDPMSTVLAVLAVLVVGLGVTVATWDRLPVGWLAGIAVAAPLPALVAAFAIQGWLGAALAGGAALALAGVAALPGAEPVWRWATLSAAAVALLEATVLAFDGATLTAVLLGQAVVLAVLAAGSRRRLPLGIGAAFGLVGVLLAVVIDAPLTALVFFPMEPFLDAAGQPQTAALAAAVLVSALVLAFAVTLVVAAGRTGLVRPDAASAGIWVPAGLVGLYGATGLVVELALLVSPDRSGFLAGHALVTVSWTLGALVLLARGLRRPALRVTGLVLVAAAVGKLVFFDLVALDGFARVAAFLGAGLVLLAAGSRYARMIEEAGSVHAEPVAADRSGG